MSQRFQKVEYGLPAKMYKNIYILKWPSMVFQLLGFDNKNAFEPFCVLSVNNYLRRQNNQS